MQHGEQPHIKRPPEMPKIYTFGAKLASTALPKTQPAAKLPNQCIVVRQGKHAYTYQRTAFYTLMNIRDKRIEQIRLMCSTSALEYVTSFYTSTVPIEALCSLLVDATERLFACPYLGLVKDIVVSLWLGLLTRQQIERFCNAVNEYQPYYICESAYEEMRRSSSFELSNVVLVYMHNILQERKSRVGTPWYKLPSMVLLYFIFLFKQEEQESIRKMLKFNIELMHLMSSTAASA